MSIWRRPLTLILMTLLVIVQAELWLGKGGVAHVMRLRSQVDAVKTRNAAAQQANDQLQAEVSDLKNGLEMVEERARSELGMVKPNEILVQYDSHAAAAKTAGVAAPTDAPSSLAAERP